MDCKQSSLCIFDTPGVQTDIHNNYVVEYYPVSSVTANSPIEFHIPGNTEDYIDVNDISLYVRLKVTKPDGSKLKHDDEVALTNLPIASLFQDVALTIGETQVEGGQMYYPYLGYFNTVMQFDPAAQKSHLEMTGWYKDDAGHFDDKKNKGWTKRSNIIVDSDLVELMGPLFLDFMRQDRYLISQTDLRLKFTPSKPEFALNGFKDTSKDFKIHFEEVILYVHRAEMNPSVINGHAAGLKKRNAMYPLQHTELITFTIPKGQKSYTKDRLFPDQAPKALMIAMVENEAFNGIINKNPFHFQHFNLSKIGLYREGRSIPGQPLTPDFAKGRTLRSYVQTMRVFNFVNTDDTNGMTPFDFKNGYTIYAYDLTADKDIGASYRQGIVSKNLRLELHFAKDLPSTINVLLYAVFDSSIEITQLRDVITHYTR